MARNRSETAQEQHRPSPPHCPCRVPSRLCWSRGTASRTWPVLLWKPSRISSLAHDIRSGATATTISWERCDRTPLLTNQTVTMPRDRTYHIQVPTNPPAATIPVIIVFHGGGHHHRQALGRRSPQPGSRPTWRTTSSSFRCAGADPHEAAAATVAGTSRSSQVPDRPTNHTPSPGASDINRTAPDANALASQHHHARPPHDHPRRATRVAFVPDEETHLAPRVEVRESGGTSDEHDRCVADRGDGPLGC
jgi:hypothetical protein